METTVFVLELIGVAAFAMSGALTAIKKKADIFGVIFLAVTTALGGGVIRDVLLGRFPPRMFVSYAYLLVALIAAVAVFADAYFRSERFYANREKIISVNNIFDAVGLAVFTVSGMNTAMLDSDNVLLILFLGVTTGIGGGILRDVMTGTMPKVLRKQVYATASLAGGIVYYVMFALGVNEIVSAFAGMAVIVTLRILATVFEWDLPAPVR